MSALVAGFSSLVSGQFTPSGSMVLDINANTLGDDLTTMFAGVTLAEKAATTVAGPIVGRSCPDGLARFYGIPVSNSTAAAAPALKAPIALTPWTTPMQTTQIKHCYQGHDCHYVEVATPDNLVSDPPIDPSLRLPTFVYFSGGGFIREDNKAGDQMGMAFHARSGINGLSDPNGKAVMVFGHFRIGPLGFLAHPGLGTGNGNWGLYDGVEVLKWIRDNIMYFGGDSSRVTIQGSSAGGAYSLMMLASPLTVGLIHNVFAMSPYASYEDAFYSPTAAYEMNMMYAFAFCGSSFAVPAVGSSEAASQAACLQSADWFNGRTDPDSMNDAAYMTLANINATGVVPAFEAYYNTPGLWTQQIGYLPWISYPNVDGVVLDMPPIQSFRTGRNAAVTAILGHAFNEYSSIFSPPGGIITTSMANHQFILGLKDLPLTAGIMDVWTASVAAPTTAQVNAAVYSSFDVANDVSGYARNIQSATDVWFARGIDLSIKALRAGGSLKTYQVLTGFAVPQATLDMMGAGGATLGAFHASQDTGNMGYWMFGADFLGLLIGLYAYGGIPWTAAELQYGQAITYYWKNAMMTGNPNGQNAFYPDWPANSDSKMVFHTAFAAGAAHGACVRIHPCVAEPTENYRAAQLAYYQNPTASPAQPATCPDPFVGAGASGLVTGSFGITLPDWPWLAQNNTALQYSCSTCSCATTGRREMLFGASNTLSRTCSCA
jgi:carboxylesterase type B